MSLSALIKKGGLRRVATATVATVATVGATRPVSVAEVATVAVANAANAPANDPAVDPDRACWPHSSAMNTGEIDLFLRRQEQFTGKGLLLAHAEALADKLVTRDQEADDRRLCLECRHLQGLSRWWCSNWRAADVARDGLAPTLVATLQRCPGFVEALS